jgi:hypothetical protein
MTAPSYSPCKHFRHHNRHFYYLTMQCDRAVPGSLILKAVIMSTFLGASQYGLLRWTWQIKDYLITKLFNSDILQQFHKCTFLILFTLKKNNSFATSHLLILLHGYVQEFHNPHGYFRLIIRRFTRGT